MLGFRSLNKKLNDKRKVHRRMYSEKPIFMIPFSEIIFWEWVKNSADAQK